MKYIEITNGDELTLMSWEYTKENGIDNEGICKEYGFHYSMP